MEWWSEEGGEASPRVLANVLARESWLLAAGGYAGGGEGPTNEWVQLWGIACGIPVAHTRTLKGNRHEQACPKHLGDLSRRDPLQ